MAYFGVAYSAPIQSLGYYEKAEPEDFGYKSMTVLCCVSSKIKGIRES